MFRKENLSRVSFIILVITLLLTAAVLLRSGLAGAAESEGAFVSREAEAPGCCSRLTETSCEQTGLRASGSLRIS